jgi:hypothetical protein
MPVARGDAFRSKSDALASSGPKGTVRSEVVEGLLCFLPFYTLVWLRRALKEAKDFSGEDLPSPWVLWGLSVLTFGFYGMYWRVSQGGALLQRIQQRAGVQNAGNLALVLAVPFVWPALMQAQLNKAWDARG